MKKVVLVLSWWLVSVALVYSQAANQFRQVTFANLGVPASNGVRYCVDCGISDAGVCTSGGTGAYAYRVDSTWNCSKGNGNGGGGGTGDVSSNTSTSTVGQGVVFSNTTGKQIGRFGETGWVKALNGVLSAQAQLNISTDTNGNLPVSRLNNGTNAGPTTFWNGAGQWVEPPGIGTVTSVNATAPAGFTFTGGPITNSGTLVLNFATGQTANQFLATPNGSTGALSLRAITAADILPAVTINRCLRVDSSGSIVVASNDCATGGSVNSVAMTVPNFLSVAGSPITTTGTFAVSLTTQSANTVLSGPTTGSATQPSFRPLVAADIPNLDAAKITTGIISAARLGSGTLDSTTCLRGNNTFTTCATGTPGGSPGQFQFNNTTFGGATNFLYTSATGQVTASQLGNGNNVIYGKRVTDSGPTGNFLQFQNQAGSSNLFKVDVNGNTEIGGALTLATTSGTDGILTIGSASAGGGIQLTTGSQPTCNSTTQFLFWAVAGGVGVKDSVSVCAKAADGTFAWRVVY